MELSPECLQNEVCQPVAVTCILVDFKLILVNTNGELSAQISDELNEMHTHFLAYGGVDQVGGIQGEIASNTYPDKGRITSTLSTSFHLSSLNDIATSIGKDVNLCPLLKCLRKGCTDRCGKCIKACAETSYNLVDKGPLRDEGGVGGKEMTCLI